MALEVIVVLTKHVPFINRSNGRAIHNLFMGHVSFLVRSVARNSSWLANYVMNSGQVAV